MVGVRAEGKFPAAVLVVFAQNLFRGKECGVGVDFERLAAFDYAVQYGVEFVREVRVLQHLFLVGRIARDVADVRHDVVFVRRVQTRKDEVEIVAVHPPPRFEEESVGKIDVPAVHEMHGVDDDVEAHSVKQFDVLFLHLRFGRKPRLYAETEFESAAPLHESFRILLPLRLVRVEVDVLPRYGRAVVTEFQVVIEVVGGGEVVKPLLFRFRDDVTDGILAVRGMPGMHVRIDVDHSSTAFILLTPAEELCSLTMRNLPSSAVLAACGPPHISLLCPIV